MSKGDKRRPGDVQAYADNYDRVFNNLAEPIECHGCGEIELRPVDRTEVMWECSKCKIEVQF